MNPKRVVVTGMAGISPLGQDWSEVRTNLLAMKNFIQRMESWDCYDSMHTRLAAPVDDFELPEHYTRKRTRSMGRVARLAVRATELALQQSGLIDHESLTDGGTGIAYGSSTGSADALLEFGRMLGLDSRNPVNGTTYVRMMSHTAAVNIGVFFGTKGRIITTSSACTAGSQGIGYAYEAIRYGHQIAMIAGGCEELSPTESAVFDVMYATSTMNSSPELTPRPFDSGRDGLVIGEGAGTLILEEYEHAKARDANILAEVIGFGTNSDGAHVTRPQRDQMAGAMRLALKDSGIPATEIGYICAHGTATEHGDIAESHATCDVLGDQIPFSSLKSYIGHTLGACGALEAHYSLEMMRENWFAPTINLNDIDSDCAPVDYIVDEPRQVDTEYIMSNNFAFGGINTSLLFRRL